MSAEQSDYINFIVELFSEHGHITYRSMFGGWGLYYNSIIFAIIVDNEVYFKVDGSNMDQYISYNSRPFEYMKSDKLIKVSSYMLLPEEILYSPETLGNWIRQSYEISLKTKK